MVPDNIQLCLLRLRCLVAGKTTSSPASYSCYVRQHTQRYCILLDHRLSVSIQINCSQPTLIQIWCKFVCFHIQIKAGTAGVPTVVPAWYDGWTLSCHIHGYVCSSTKLFNQPVNVRGSVTDLLLSRRLHSIGGTIETLSFCWSWIISSWSTMSQTTTIINSKLAN